MISLIRIWLVPEQPEHCAADEETYKPRTPQPGMFLVLPKMVSPQNR